MKHGIYILFVICTFNLKAQLLFNSGQIIYSEPGTITYVQGSVQNDGNGLINHNGYMVVDSSYINNNGNTKGNGVYDVYVNWENNANFQRDTSHVHLKGNNQLITGDSLTAFYNLTCEGSGVKHQTINSEVHKYLNLTNRELATDNDTMFVFNTSPLAMQYISTFNAEGFVSNLDSGALVRATNNSAAYVFPMGNTTGTQRFRQVDLKPNDTNNNLYAISFHNENPNNKGFNPTDVDTSLCIVNDKFFHKSARLSGSSSADLKFYYLPVDGSFDAIGNYKGGPTNWSDIHGTYLYTQNNYKSIERLTWSNFSDLPYSLGTIKENPSISANDTLFCGVDTVYLTAPAYANNTYNWNIGTGTIVSGAGTNQIGVVFGTPGIQNISLTLMNNQTGCSSNQSNTFPVVISAGPTANFGIITNPIIVNNPIAIQDSSINAVQWSWELGNGETSTTQNPQAIYGALGTYTVQLIAYDQYGCMDTLVKEIFVDGNFIIPNIFTPNDDGTNDIFTIKNLGLKELKVLIHNRWGDLVYSGEEGTASWDGTTPSGEKCSEGTYFYIIEGLASGKKKTYNGFVQLSR